MCPNVTCTLRFQMAFSLFLVRLKPTASDVFAQGQPQSSSVTDELRQMF